MKKSLSLVDEIRQVIRKATLNLEIVPVLCGSAFKNKGVQPLLDAIVAYLPSPLDIPPVIGVDDEGHDVVATNFGQVKNFARLLLKLYLIHSLGI